VTPIFRALGGLLACYVLYALATGRVYAKSGPAAQTWLRSDGWRFWTTLTIYALLAVALLFWF
jgi:hypothetical protein